MRGDFMATRSILKSVNINNKNVCKNFVNALERSEKRSCRNKAAVVECREVKGSEIKDLFK